MSGTEKIWIDVFCSEAIFLHWKGFNHDANKHVLEVCVDTEAAIFQKYDHLYHSLN